MNTNDPRLFLVRAAVACGVAVGLACTFDAVEGKGLTDHDDMTRNPGAPHTTMGTEPDTTAADAERCNWDDRHLYCVEMPAPME